MPVAKTGFGQIRTRARPSSDVDLLSGFGDQIDAVRVRSPPWDLGQSEEGFFRTQRSQIRVEKLKQTREDGEKNIE